jgi:phosphoglucosamine mutase
MVTMDQFREGGEAVAPYTFGTDGIRGKVDASEATSGETVITPELAQSFGAATAEAVDTKRIVIGRDTRESGAILSDAAMDGARAAGVTAIDLGVIPTPGVAFLARELHAAGMVVTASHNPYNDNGLKAFMPNGSKPDEATTARIEHLINFSGERRTPISRGDVVRHAGEALREVYESHLVHSVDADLFQGQRIVIDAAHGAAYEVAEQVVGQLRGQTLSIAASPDGRNINQGCGATNPEVAARHVVGMGADFGITLDGDADRVMLISQTGRVIDGDRIMLINALAAKRRGELPNNLVVGTIMTNMGTEEAFKEQGIDFIRTDVGDTAVARMMEEKGAAVGGEQSGHIILSKYANTGDGILAALQTMQSLRELSMSLDEADSLIEDYAQVLVKTKVPAEVKDSIAGHPAVEAGQQEFHDTLAARGLAGRVNVRASGTEPVIRVMVEVEPGYGEHAQMAAAGLLQIISNVAGGE